MPNPVNAIKNQQWDICQRCGRAFPVGRLTVQDGLRICTQRVCFDNEVIRRRDRLIIQILSEGEQVEGVDMRFVDQAFFPGHDEENL